MPFGNMENRLRGDVRLAKIDHSRSALKLVDARRRGLFVESLGKDFGNEKFSSIKRHRLKSKKESETDKEIIHQACMHIIENIRDFGDYSLLYKFVTYLRPDEIECVKAWFADFGRLDFDSRTKKFTLNKQKVLNFDSAEANPYWKFTRAETSNTAEFYNIEDKLVALVRRARQMKAKGLLVDELALLSDLENVLNGHGVIAHLK